MRKLTSCKWNHRGLARRVWLSWLIAFVTQFNKFRRELLRESNRLRAELSGYLEHVHITSHSLPAICPCD